MIKIDWNTGDPPKAGYYLVKHELPEISKRAGLPNVTVHEWNTNPKYLYEHEDGMWVGIEPESVIGWVSVEDIE